MTFKEHKKNEREKRARREDIVWIIFTIVVFALLGLILTLIK